LTDDVLITTRSGVLLSGKIAIEQHILDDGESKCIGFVEQMKL
jgi:hypothetical protein